MWVCWSLANSHFKPSTLVWPSAPTPLIVLSTHPHSSHPKLLYYSISIYIVWIQNVTVLHRLHLSDLLSLNFSISSHNIIIQQDFLLITQTPVSWIWSAHPFGATDPVNVQSIWLLGALRTLNLFTRWGVRKLLSSQKIIESNFIASSAIF